MRIGELARRAGTTTRTLRYYESRGLLPARRAENGYRSYDEGDTSVRAEVGTQPARADLMVFRAGEPVKSIVGARPKRRLLQELEDVLAPAGPTEPHRTDLDAFPEVRI
ncbi:MerR family DNA-binding transcriptional regulator [Streptomyces sp. CA-278952]|uniref:MerR family DNA-binding transcriptional regulator n=1 Tax=unclassified Streptomyces TaxID=2593676 RepID=UPI0022419E50|nr:MerR family DNA-binding transcriptional regulator [Streptomyces sp. CA-278952]UZI28651.1 MerR family DNA-binding transcriptional regulator [Streptomyces sp. VB1]WDG28590.1 MerR family DNA-binding transcriptional regulator [Streptomyces sp. CA-278952]